MSGHKTSSGHKPAPPVGRATDSHSDHLPIPSRHQLTAGVIPSSKRTRFAVPNSLLSHIQQHDSGGVLSPGTTSTSETVRTQK
ncbi:hypothetical protein D9619_009285 [Psilocybe cf. subviscida]|uniref:Uncharacterized protein n=1 Tax=Psilocybe cf. subviscida TaxID=2480587 RepID=A0A8H5BWQ1_9AGAR|nr:hypothetical protein D9619_009285 [Psilocybe cf. subviscida]